MISDVSNSNVLVNNKTNEMNAMCDNLRIDVDRLGDRPFCNECKIKIESIDIRWELISVLLNTHIHC